MSVRTSDESLIIFLGEACAIVGGWLHQLLDTAWLAAAAVAVHQAQAFSSHQPFAFLISIMHFLIPESFGEKGSSNSGVLHFTFTSHLLIFTSSHLHIFTSSHPHIFTFSLLSSCFPYIFTSSHLHIFSSSYLLIFASYFSPSHLQILTSSHPHILTSSHPHNFTSSHHHILSISHHIFSTSHFLIFTSSHSHLYILSCPFALLTSSHSHILTSSHLLILTSSHLHIFSSSHLLIFTSSHLYIFTSSHPHILTFSHPHIFTFSLALLLSCPLALLPSCSLALFFFLHFYFSLKARGSDHEMARNATFSQGTSFARQKLKGDCDFTTLAATLSWLPLRRNPFRTKRVSIVENFGKMVLFLYDNNMALAADCSFIRFDVQTVVNCCVYLCLLLLRAFLFPFC